MKRSTVVVPWQDGLKFRSAARIIQAARKCQSDVVLRCGDHLADARSIVNLVMLCAIMGMSISIEATGGDEQMALDEVVRVFAPDFDQED